MSRRTTRRILIGLALLVAVPVLLWFSLSYQPHYYRTARKLTPQQQRETAKRFYAQRLQLLNDITNEPRWEAVFSDQEVNAWIAEDLVTHFADQLPPEVHEPRVIFEPDRATLAFLLDQGPFRSVISVVVRVRVPEKNMIELALERIRAGAVPFPPEPIIDRISQRARDHGLDIRWKEGAEHPTALIRYTPDRARTDVVLEHIAIRNGQIRLAGRSNRIKGAVAPVLPRHKVLQLTFPRRKTHGESTDSTLRSDTSPTS